MCEGGAEAEVAACEGMWVDVVDKSLSVDDVTYASVDGFESDVVSVVALQQMVRVRAVMVSGQSLPDEIEFDVCRNEFEPDVVLIGLEVVIYLCVGTLTAVEMNRICCGATLGERASRVSRACFSLKKDGKLEIDNTTRKWRIA